MTGQNTAMMFGRPKPNKLIRLECIDESDENASFTRLVTSPVVSAVSLNGNG